MSAVLEKELIKRNREIMKNIASGLNKISSYVSKIDKKKRRDRELQECFDQIRSHSGKELEEQIEEYRSNVAHLDKVKEFNKRFLGGYKNIGWNMLLCTQTGIMSEKFIPEDVFVNHIEPRLNNVHHARSFQEKNNYDTIFQDIRRPETLVRYVNGTYYNAHYEHISIKEVRNILAAHNKPLLLKPTLFSGMGRGIEIFQSGQEEELINFIHKNKSTHYTSIVQSWVNQHPELAKVYSGSVNTLKTITLRIDGKIVHLMTRLNFGGGTSHTDKIGYIVGVNENGDVQEVAFNKQTLKKQKMHNDSEIAFGSIHVPSFDMAVSMCKKAHQRLLHFDMVSWDIAIDSEGIPVLIELNIKSQGIVQMQLTNGPLFGEHTEKILQNMNLNLYFNI